MNNDKRKRSRSRSSDKKDKNNRSKHHDDRKQKREKESREEKSKNWNEDKINDAIKKTSNYDVLDIIRKERAEQQEKIERNFVEKGWTTVKVKNPLNIYEQLMQKNIVKPHQPVNPSLLNNPIAPKLIEVIVNDRLGKKEKIKCCPQDTVGQFKKLISAKTGTRSDKIRLQRQHQVLKDHITLEDYEVMHEMQLEMYYN